MNRHSQWSITRETQPRLEASVEAAAQSSEAEVRGVAHKEVAEVVSREPVKISNKEDKVNITISEAAEAAEEAEGLAGETTTSHSATEIPLLLFVLAGL